MSIWTGDIHLGTGIQLPPYKASMETESVRSGYSEQSRRSRNHASNRIKSPKHLVRANNRGDERSEVIEVQILNQDDNWGENTTAITGNTSDRSSSIEDLAKIGKELDQTISFKCQMWTGTLVAAILSFCAFISPIAMVILPRIDFFEWRIQKCGPECDGLLISFSFKLLILVVGSWALFFRKPKSTLPRIFIYRALILALIFVFIFSYWLFYAVRILEKRLDDYELSYHSIVLFAVSLVDALLFIHYLAVILLEIKQLQPQYFIKVVRSPDGESQCYNMGQLSIQRAAAWILERYYRDFPIYNPYLETLPTKSPRHNKSNSTGYKVYEVDGITNSGAVNGQTRMMAAPRRDSSHNERFYEEHEYQRRVKKRKSRLITASEEAFTHIKRLQGEQGPAIPLDPMEAAQAIFPSMARALQKYLRITRQQPRHTMQSILEHLALCLSHDLSPRAFLEKYMVPRPVLQNEREHIPFQTWALVCDTLLSRSVEPGCVFLLRQNDVSLLVTVHSLPHFNITEEILEPKANKFVLRLNSETSV